MLPYLVGRSHPVLHIEKGLYTLHIYIRSHDRISEYIYIWRVYNPYRHVTLSHDKFVIVEIRFGVEGGGG
jgi:hypothetical protein